MLFAKVVSQLKFLIGIEMESKIATSTSTPASLFPTLVNMNSSMDNVNSTLVNMNSNLVNMNSSVLALEQSFLTKKKFGGNRMIGGIVHPLAGIKQIS